MYSFTPSANKYNNISEMSILKSCECTKRTQVHKNKLLDERVQNGRQLKGCKEKKIETRLSAVRTKNSHTTVQNKLLGEDRKIKTTFFSITPSFIKSVRGTV